MTLVMFRAKPDGVLFAKYPVFVLAPILFVACYFVTSDVLASAAISCAVPCVINGRSVSSQLRHIRSLNDHYPIFIRDLIESRKVNPNFVMSIRKILDSTDLDAMYGSYADVLKQIRSRLKHSDYNEYLIYDHTIPSWRLRMLMFVLQTIYDADRGDIQTLERMHKFIVKINDIKNNLSDSILLSSLMLYLTAPLFFIVLVGMSVFMSSFTFSIPELPENLRGSAELAGLFERPDFTNLLDSLRPAFFVMSICSGITISRVTYASFYATLPIGICMSSAFVILAGWDLFFDILFDLLSTLFSP